MSYYNNILECLDCGAEFTTIHISCDGEECPYCGSVNWVLNNELEYYYEEDDDTFREDLDLIPDDIDYGDEEDYEDY
jgi:hypothetical protein